MSTRGTLPGIALWIGLGLVLGLQLPLAAQEGSPSADEAAAMEAMMKAGMLGKEHAYLAKQVGTFSATITMWSDPSAPPMVSEGKAERKMILGGRVLEESFHASVMGMPFEGLAHTGFDNVIGKYWSTWSDSFTTSITLLEGTMDEATGRGTFEGPTSEPLAGKKVPMRIEMRVEDGKEISEMYMPGPDGELVKTMEVAYQRQ